MFCGGGVSDLSWALMVFTNPIARSLSKKPFALSLSKGQGVIRSQGRPFTPRVSKKPFALSLSKGQGVIRSQGRPFTPRLSKKPFALSLSKGAGPHGC